MRVFFTILNFWYLIIIEEIMIFVWFQSKLDGRQREINFVLERKHSSRDVGTLTEIQFNNSLSSNKTGLVVQSSTRTT